MKCSKCGYLGFDSSERCRNCGYEFSLAESAEIPDLPLLSPPLESLDNDTPLITKPSSPRAPLAVRRSTPDTARIRGIAATRAATAAELALDFQSTPKAETPASSKPLAARIAQTPVHHQDAGLSRRVIAAAIDMLILLAVDLIVVYFTMQICGVSVNELGLLPKGPLATFLLVQDVGYLIAFTTGGQTLGKMAAGIKVVAGDYEGCVDVPCALKRTLLSLLLAAPAGIGLLPAVFDRQHRGLHDRFAGTRVVRASA